MRWIWIDRILELEKGVRSVAIKNVAAAEDVLHDHFAATKTRPAMPVLPNTLIIEGMAQTAGAIVIKHDSNSGKKNIVLMLGVDKAKFRKPAGPGDTIEFHIAKIQRRRNVGRYKAEAIVDGTVIAEAEITAMIVEAAS
jgi:3-hydroxyacyl-[acyl-carrier-protein] dehydratase